MKRYDTVDTTRCDRIRQEIIRQETIQDTTNTIYVTLNAPKNVNARINVLEIDAIL